MNRRRFFGAVGKLSVGSLVPLAVLPSDPVETPVNALPIRRMDGKGLVLGIATETVQVGDFVQIQTLGPANGNYTTD